MPGNLWCLRAALITTATPAEVEEFLRSRLAPYKIPKQWEVVDELPMTTTGKIRRAELRARTT